MPGLKLGLEVEGRDGVTRMRPLQLGTDNIGVLAEADWNSLDTGTDRVTVRLIDLGPMVWWNGVVAQAGDDTRNGYWVEDGTPNGGLVPDAFELADPDGQRVLYTVDRLTVATAGGGRVLRFSTTPDVPAGVASVLVSRQDWDYNCPGIWRGSGGPPGPDDLYHVFPLTTARAVDRGRGGLCVHAGRGRHGAVRRGPAQGHRSGDAGAHGRGRVGGAPAAGARGGLARGCNRGGALPPSARGCGRCV